MKKIIYAIIALFVLTGKLYAQQPSMFTHYMHNTLAVNPGYAGSREALSIAALNRMQWTGFKNAPVTQTLTLHSPVFSENIGLGFAFLHDQIGHGSTFGFAGSFAYKINLSPKLTLRLGLNASVDIWKYRFSELALIEETGGTSVVDPAFQTDSKKTLPNFGAGVLLKHPRFYVGISSGKLLENKLDANSDLKTSAKENRTYYAIAGAVFPLGVSLKLQPSTYIKYMKEMPIELDLTARLIIKDFVSAGITYRTGDAAGLLLGVNLTEQFYIGYSYDYHFSNRTFKHNNGSHEVVLTYDFIFQGKKIKSPRYL